MADEIISMGTISARGQIAVPAKIRQKMGLRDGQKVVFMLQDNTLILKKVVTQTWDDITAPVRKQKKPIREQDIADLVHRARKKQ